MYIAICEDDEMTSSLIKEYVSDIFNESSVECEVDVFDCAADLEGANQKFDLVFLDCRLPDKNGMDIARDMRAKGDEAALIFVTAFEDYVYDSFEVNAFRYILKPIDKELLRKSITAFLRNYEKDAYVEIPTAHKSHIVKLDEIVYIEANDKRSVVRLINQAVDSNKTIAEYESEITSPAFFRTHRRFLLNMKYISDISKNVITLINGERVEVSRRNTGAFNKSYINYLKYSIKTGK